MFYKYIAGESKILKLPYPYFNVHNTILLKLIFINQQFYKEYVLGFLKTTREI